MERIIVGEKYGRLTVLENHHPKDEVVCRCECGKIKIARASNVFYGGTKSCGCYFAEGNNLKHGGKGTRLYIIWKAMRERCNTPSYRGYKNYGGRGIKVCKDWNDFNVFKEWALSHGYNDKLTIDRIDVNGNYDPNNCRWITNKEQQNNKRNNHFLTLDEETLTIAQWSEKLNISQNAIRRRLNKGYPIEQVLSTFRLSTKHESSTLHRRTRVKFEPIQGEEWKVFEKDKRLRVSNYGRVLYAKENFLILPVITDKGFWRIWYDYKEYMLNRMVAECFLDNPNNCRYVLYKDGNKDNNRADNLIWSNRKVVVE